MKPMHCLLFFATAFMLASPLLAQDNRVRTEFGADVQARSIVDSLRKLTPTEADGQTPQEASVALPVTFEFARAELTAAGRKLLDVAATALNDPALIPHAFTVEGHTDAVGSQASNLILSQHRAEAVRDYLVGLGVDPARLHTAGFGKSRLIPGVDPGDERQRRVELVRLP